MAPKWIRTLFAATALVAAAAAPAATVTVGGWSTDPGDGINFSYPGGGGSATAGRFVGNVTSFTGLDAAEFVDGTSQLFAYCYDLGEYLGSNTYFVAPGAAAKTLDFLGAVNALLGGDAFAWLHVTDRNVAAAIQLGIWDSLYDGDFNLATGAFSATGIDSATQSAFDAFIANLGAADLSASLVMVLLAEGGSNGQDVITGRRQSTSVPEPGSLALLGLAALAATITRRRRV
jgi:hypothetical protein